MMQSLKLHACYYIVYSVYVRGSCPSTSIIFTSFTLMLMRAHFIFLSNEDILLDELCAYLLVLWLDRNLAPKIENFACDLMCLAHSSR